MVVIKVKGDSIEKTVRHDIETNKIIRQQNDQLFGKGVFRTGKDRPQRGDYRFCREADKFTMDMRKAKNMGDEKAFKEISKEYHRWQAKQRKYGEYVK